MMIKNTTCGGADVLSSSPYLTCPPGRSRLLRAA
jgi:hypothetical protein